MSGKRFSWTQPSCEGCWIDRNPGRVPTRLKPEVREQEKCVHCGAETKSGIFVRVDPATASYPTRMKD